MALTVSQLIDELEKYQRDIEVVIPNGGDGGGYDRIRSVSQICVSLLAEHAESWHGELNVSDQESGSCFYPGRFDVVLINSGT